MFERFYQVVDPVVRFSPREKRQLEGAFAFRELPRRHTLVAVGDIAREFYFVHEGLLRLAYLKEGEEITAFFFPEGLFAASLDSFLSQTPSLQQLDTLEPSQLLVLTAEALDRLYTDLPRLNVFIRKLLEQRFINAQRVFASFLLETPEQRYLRFLEQHPQLLQRVPQHLIASYLGVTPVSLSRIRQRIKR